MGKRPMKYRNTQNKKQSWFACSQKKGKLRLVAKNLIKKKPSTCKKPACAKSATTLNVPYVRHGAASRKNRMEQAQWSCNLKDIYAAPSEKHLIDMLIKQGVLEDWDGASCPACGVGTLGPLRDIPGRGWQYKCGHRHCRRILPAHHQHPVLSVASGSRFVPLQDQAAVLFCCVANVKRSTAHLLTGMNHKLIEGIYTRFEERTSEYVVAKENDIEFGHGIPWADVEADEVDLRKSLQCDEDGNEQLAWEQWGGLVQRGAPETLVLTRLDPMRTKLNAPGPGPIRKRDWKPTATRWLQGRKVVLHTDGARAYKMAINGVVHDNVVHQKKRRVINGKAVWLKPAFTKVTVHSLPDSTRLAVKAGTQVIDRFWRSLRSHLEGVSSRVNSRTLHMKVRLAQWVYWNRGADLWSQAAAVMKHASAKGA
jgi:hypothetical protein